MCEMRVCVCACTCIPERTCTRQLFMETEGKLRVVELEVITVNKPKALGGFEHFTSKKGNRFSLKNNIPFFFLKDSGNIKT